MCSSFVGSIRATLEDILYNTLVYKYVAHNDEVFQVMFGSVMGDVQSGAVSDLAFAAKVEDKLRLAELKVPLMVRLRDDISAVVDGDANAAVHLLPACLRQRPRYGLPQLMASATTGSPCWISS